MLAHEQMHKQLNAIVKGDGCTVGLMENNGALRWWIVDWSSDLQDHYMNIMLSSEENKTVVTIIMSEVLVFKRHLSQR